MSPALTAFNRKHSNVQSGIEEAITLAIANVLSNVHNYVGKEMESVLTKDVMSELYPHEVMTEEERLSEAKQYAIDALSNSLNFLSTSYAKSKILAKAKLD
jgi:hypothetical protein